jgi:hypothetical protein
VGASRDAELPEWARLWTVSGRPPRAPDEALDLAVAWTLAACLVEHGRAAESAAAPREETPRKTWARLRRRLRDRFEGARGYSHETMTWRDAMIVAAISALLAAAITVAVRIVIENLTF